MGLKAREQSKFVNIKDGQFYLSTDKEKGYGSFEGTLRDISFKDDEFEGQKIRKMVLKMEDSDGESYLISVNFDSSYASSLIGFLKNADLTQPLELVGVCKEENGKKKRSILVKQDGSWVKAFYTKDKPNGLPEMVQNKRTGKWNKDDFGDFLENVVLNELKPQIAGESKPKAKGLSNPKTVTNDFVESLENDIASDLPF